MIETIRVTMLGGLSVCADDTIILDSAAKVNKPWQVFCFLLLNRRMPSAPGRMIAALWPDEMLSDPGNVLKNTVYALRREFKEVQSDGENPILFENGGYICNPAIHFEIDCEQFELYCQQAEKSEGEQRTQTLTCAVELYKGELLPQLENESWVMPLALYYKKRFTEVQSDLCTILYTQERHSELLAVATAASRIDPLEEAYYLYIFRALYAMGMNRVIITTYHKAERIFSEEMGAQLRDEIKEIYQRASEHMDKIEQDIMIIKEGLNEVANDSRPISGPLFCTYDVFKYLYQMVARSSERSGSRVIVLLITLQSEEGGMPPAKQLSTSMGLVKNLILGGLLRRSDTVARYSRSQFIVMLTIDQIGSTQAVTDRIQRRCEPYLAANGIRMVFATTELEPLAS